MAQNGHCGLVLTKQEHFEFHFGWSHCSSLRLESSILVPGTLAVITALWLFERLRDRPQSLGLPDVEVYREEPVKEKSEAEQKEEDDMSYVQIFKNMYYATKLFGCLRLRTFSFTSSDLVQRTG